jgi:hypothetical protein
MIFTKVRAGGWGCSSLIKGLLACPGFLGSISTSKKKKKKENQMWKKAGGGNDEFSKGEWGSGSSRVLKQSV